jgi:hypothetical protein
VECCPTVGAGRCMRGIAAAKDPAGGMQVWDGNPIYPPGLSSSLPLDRLAAPDHFKATNRGEAQPHSFLAVKMINCERSTHGSCQVSTP